MCRQYRKEKSVSTFFSRHIKGRLLEILPLCQSLFNLRVVIVEDCLHLHK